MSTTPHRNNSHLKRATQGALSKKGRSYDGFVSLSLSLCPSSVSREDSHWHTGVSPHTECLLRHSVLYMSLKSSHSPLDMHNSQRRHCSVPLRNNISVERGSLSTKIKAELTTTTIIITASAPIAPDHDTLNLIHFICDSLSKQEIIIPLYKQLLRL